jgi:hypothetical protein
LVLSHVHLTLSHAPIVNQVPYRHALTAQIHIAYDAYLQLSHGVDMRINWALARDTPNWRTLNSCPACEYRLENEPKLSFSKLVSIDGNNSLRRIDPTLVNGKVPLPDPRSARSDYWLSAQEVDTFKDEVKAKAVKIPKVIFPFPMLSCLYQTF